MGAAVPVPDTDVASWRALSARRAGENPTIRHAPHRTQIAAVVEGAARQELVFDPVYFRAASSHEKDGVKKCWSSAVMVVKR
jgi:hypothetical protein